MKKAAHTPGPWRIVTDQPPATRVGHAICSVEKAFGTISIHAEPDDKPCPDIATWNEMSEANATLIAAAPETARKLAEVEGRLERLGGIEGVSVLGWWKEADRQACRAEKAEAKIAALCDEVVRAQNRRDEAEARIVELGATVKDLCDILNPYSHAIGEAGREKLQKAFSMIAP